MNKVFKTIIKVGLISVILVVLLILIYACIVYNNIMISAEQYRIYSPACQESTKWICQEERIFFVTQKQSQRLYGAIESEENTRQFIINFPPRGACFGVDSIEAATGDDIYEFGGEVKYADGMCILTYDADDDEEHFWGDKTGEVTLTFIKEDLP